MALATILARANLKTVATALLATKVSAVNGLVQFSGAPVRTASDTILPTRTWASGTLKSLLMPLFDGGSTTTTWSRKQKPPH